MIADGVRRDPGPLAPGWSRRSPAGAVPMAPDSSAISPACDISAADLRRAESRAVLTAPSEQFPFLAFFAVRIRLPFGRVKFMSLGVARKALMGRPLATSGDRAVDRDL